MTEPNQLPAGSSTTEPGVPSLVEPLPDLDHDWVLPGRRLAAVAVLSIVLAVCISLVLLLPQPRHIAVPLCVSLIPLFVVALVAAVALAAAGKGVVPVAPLL